jgi:hypothetical protein
MATKEIKTDYVADPLHTRWRAIRRGILTSSSESVSSTEEEVTQTLRIFGESMTATIVPRQHIAQTIFIA